MKKPTKHDLIEKIVVKEYERSTAEPVELQPIEDPIPATVKWENRFLLSSDLRQELWSWVHSNHP
jgi:hypothetical protein